MEHIKITNRDYLNLLSRVKDKTIEKYRSKADGISMTHYRLDNLRIIALRRYGPMLIIKLKKLDNINNTVTIHYEIIN